MKSLLCIAVLVCALAANTFAQADKKPLFDMDAIRDASTLDIQVHVDWHDVAGNERAGIPATRQKHITILVGELWKGAEYRVPVRFVVPAEGKAKHLHLTGSHHPERLKPDARPQGVDRILLANGVGLVQTVVQTVDHSGSPKLIREAGDRFARTLDPHSSIQFWGWPAALMRALTAAHAETEHFAAGKVAMSGGSKNGASPSAALLHDKRMTAVHASVSPIWDSPLRLLDEAAWKERGGFPGGSLQHGFLGGIYGPNYTDQALRAGHSWEELRAFAKGIAADVFVSRNLKQLEARGVDLLFHPGTHDFVCFDIAHGGANFPQIPVYLKANTGHGGRPHPKAERPEENKSAFLLHHLLGSEPLLSPPQVETELDARQLHVEVRFADEQKAESGRIWWFVDRPLDGTRGYLQQKIPDDNWADMDRKEDGRVWVAEIEVPAGAKRVDVFSNHRKTIAFEGRKMPTYISSPYTRVVLPVAGSDKE